MSDGNPPPRPTVLQRPLQSRRSVETPNTQPSATAARLNSSFSGTTSSLDPNEFPSLTSRPGNAAPSTSYVPLPPGSKPYVGMVKLATAEQTEFTMTSEDFPALPGPSRPGNVPLLDRMIAGNVGEGSSRMGPQRNARGIQMANDGLITNIPPSMIANQFGIIGLLRMIRTAETDPHTVSLTLGQDLTSLGLDLNSAENLYLNFGGPLADRPCKPQDIDFQVPPEYRMPGSVREKLAPLNLGRYKEDMLFYLFYSFVGDKLQIAAAMELYDRDWRYHMEEKAWICQAPGMPTIEKTATHERGTYFFFDAYNWRRVPKDFRLEYSKLEGRPRFPPM